MADHCLRSRNYVNVIVAGKQPELQWLDMDAAIKHCTARLGIWKWASNDGGEDPDVVMACAGDVLTLETLAAVDLLRQHFPALKIRVINVVDLMTPLESGIIEKREANRALHLVNAIPGEEYCRCMGVNSADGMSVVRCRIRQSGEDFFLRCNDVIHSHKILNSAECFLPS